MSKNAEGLVRHRGGNCPVDGEIKVETRQRGGQIVIENAQDFWWEHRSNNGDIMAYRLHKQAERVEIIEHRGRLEPITAAKLEQLEGPLKWRDRITEIDATTQALTAERAELVQKLASEGFAFIGRAQDALIGLPRDEWKVGDLVVRVMDGEESGMPLNEPMKITFFDGSDRGQDVEVGGKYFPKVSSLRWHSRPSA